MYGTLGCRVCGTCMAYACTPRRWVRTKELDFSWRLCRLVCPLPWSHGPARSSKMPRLPLPLLAPRFAALTQPPAQIKLQPIRRPRISDNQTRRRFLCPSQPFCSSSSPGFIATPRRVAHSIPKRIPNADWPYLYHGFDKMAHLDPYFKQVDDLQNTFIERLREAVAIPSISSEDQRRPDVVKVCMPAVYKAIIARVSRLNTASDCGLDGTLACRADQGSWWHCRAP